MSRAVAFLLAFGFISSAVATEGERRPIRPGTIEATCGNDRGCRLQYLRDHGLRRRRTLLQREEQRRALDDRRLQALREAARPVRDAKSLGTDLFLSSSSLIGNGGLLGFSFHPHLRVEAHLAYSSGDAYDGVRSSSLNLSGATVGARLRGFLRTDELTLYGAAGPAAMFLGGDSYAWDEFGSTTSTSASAEAHGALLALGFEWQLQAAPRIGLEFQYFLPWYASVYDRSSGTENATLTDAFEDTLSSRAFGVGFLLGWAW